MRCMVSHEPRSTVSPAGLRQMNHEFPHHDGQLITGRKPPHPAAVSSAQALSSI
jgi:hypothetical protein